MRYFKAKNVPLRESTYVCTTLGFVSGFLEAYTYLTKGGVFCNAQTGNVAMLGIDLAQRDFSGAARYVAPIIAYFIGIAITVFSPRLLGRYTRTRWETVFIALEIVLLGAIGFMPQSVPHIVPNVLVSFICAMQYNTFRKHNDVTLATTFCTNNLRQTALHFMQWVKTKERAAMRKSLDYLVVIAAFLGGAVVSALACRVLDGRAVWVACGVLVPVLAALVLFNKDKKPDKQKEA